jgi:cullin-4
MAWFWGDKNNIDLSPFPVCRCHESVDRGLLKSLLRMLVDLQVYQEVFEIEFLHETEAAYRAEALRMMRDSEFTVSQW